MLFKQILQKWKVGLQGKIYHVSLSLLVKLSQNEQAKLQLELFELRKQQRQYEREKPRAGPGIG